jgi:hypothetical protein
MSEVLKLPPIPEISVVKIKGLNGFVKTVEIEI